MVNKNSVVFETTYPLYCVRTLGDRHVLVAGGGGQAKTGVPNRLEIFLFDLDDGSWDFRKTTIVDSGVEATMNLDVFPLDIDKGRFLIACGQEGNCRIYETHFDVAELTNDFQLLPPKTGVSTSRKRHRTNSTSNSHVNGLISSNKQIKRKLTLNFDEFRSFQTDFTNNPKTGGPFQKVVRFSPAGGFLVTGGADGHFRVWDVNSCKKILDHNAHKDDVDDLDVSPDGTKLVTVGRDSAGFLWSTKDAAKLADLAKEPGVLPTKYRFRFARFSAKSAIFFTVAIPVVRSSSSKQSCVVARWRVNDQNSCRPTRLSALPPAETVSAMSASADGAYLAFGTLGGSVLVLDAENLTTLRYWRETHGIFVTSLDFLPSSAKFRPQSAFCPMLSNAKCALLSVSADDCAQLHQIPLDPAVSFTWSIIFFILFWATLFYLLVFLEL